MNYRSVIYVLGKILIVLGTLMVLPLLVGVYYSMQGAAEAPYHSFLIPIAVSLGSGFLLSIKKPKKVSIFAKEGFVICGVGWIVASLIGALPFVISGAIPNFVDAFFETASGLTTTGASILSEIASLPKSILFWRSFTHWIGGMGLLSFMIAIVPKSKGNSMHVMKAEVPGLSASKIVSKISESARILYSIYFALTVLMIFVQFVGGRIVGDNIAFYDCVVNALSTAGTGGFSVLNNSILGYNSTFLEITISVFMFLFGVNFNLYFLILKGKIKSVFMDEEFKTYVFVNIACVALITINISNLYSNIGYALKDSLFTVNAVMSTTGFGTADFNTWPTFSKIILMLIMFVGGCAGSTGGGMKVARIMLYFKQLVKELRQMLYPHEVVLVKMNKRAVDANVVKGINSYFIVYVITLAASTLLVSINGFDTETTFTAVISCFNNIGPGLGAVGPTGNYADFSVLSKLVLVFDMLAGRLELFPMLLLLSPKTWKRTV